MIRLPNLLDLLKHRGAKLDYYDPHVPVIGPTREHSHWAGKRSIEWTHETIEQNDVVIISTAHTGVNYAELGSWAKCIVDTRNAMATVKETSTPIWKA